MRRDYAVGFAALDVFLLVRPCTRAAVEIPNPE